MHLKTNERALLQRRRQGLTQTQMAERLDMTVRDYVLFESGKSGCAKSRLRLAEQFIPRLGKLASHERCLIMRRRAGTTQAQVAKELKCSRRWVTLMETGRAPVDDLVWYWEQ